MLAPFIGIQCAFANCTIAMSQPETRRELNTLSVQELQEIVERLQLPTTGRKSALVDRITRTYRLRRQAQAAQSSDTASSHRVSCARSPTRTPACTRTTSRAPDPVRLEETVQQLVDESMQGLEERLLQTLRPLISSHNATAENISLPSPAPHAQPTTPADIDAACTIAKLLHGPTAALAGEGKTKDRKR